jgi:hypothetical protein
MSRIGGGRRYEIRARTSDCSKAGDAAAAVVYVERSQSTAEEVAEFPMSESRNNLSQRSGPDSPPRPLS